MNRVSGYKNQLTIQVALATALAKAVKAGQYTGSIGVPEKLVLIGHSFGSAISGAIAASEPDLAQGLILTGMSPVSFPTPAPQWVACDAREDVLEESC